MDKVLVTGASSGLGLESALYLTKKGYVVFGTSRNPNNFKKSIPFRLIKLEITDLTSIEACLSKVLSLSGKIDVLINNAGVAWTGDLLSMPFEKWEWIMQMNLTSIFQVCSEVVPLMRKKGGLVINVSSHASRNVFPQWGAYCVSKAALASFTKCLAEEERKNFIRACTLTLGSVNSSLWDSDSVGMQFDRDSMLSVDQVAVELLHLASQPTNQIIEDVTLMPSAGAF